MAKTGLFLLYLIIGLYVLNLGLALVNLPEQIVFLNQWFSVAAGVLLVISSFRFLREYSTTY